MKAAFAIFTMAALAMMPTVSSAVLCRDAKGKFIKCAAAKPAPPKKCKDAGGKFAKCGTPGAKPV